jgi:hypothetical protein
MKPSTIRPGLLVALKTNVVGNINYHKRDLGAKIDKKTGAEIVEWETTRTISDPKEFKAANQIRMKARGFVWNVCAKSSFGLLCPEDKANVLAEAINKAQKLADGFNAKAKCTRVNVNVIAGRVASDDVEATKAINGEVRELLDRMEQGVKKLDVKAIRDAANRAKSLSGIVAPGTDERLKAAVNAARDAARKLVKAGETAAKEVDQEALKTLKASRTAFLDLDVTPHSGDDVENKPSRAKAKKRALDLAAD